MSLLAYKAIMRIRERCTIMHCYFAGGLKGFGLLRSDRGSVQVRFRAVDVAGTDVVVHAGAGSYAVGNIRYHTAWSDCESWITPQQGE